MTLRIGRGLALPEEAVTQTFAVLAKRGVGKTYTASVMTEEMLKAGLPVVAIDPIGVWWGLRASADGKREGLPIVVFGGDHGDVPLEKTAGQVLADLVVDERLSCVLDLSSFRKGEQIRFMTDFAERLYRRNREPLHLMIDEADSFAPQRTMKLDGKGLTTPAERAFYDLSSELAGVPA
jgi:DNA helicase HerA-like ATPase